MLILRPHLDFISTLECQKKSERGVNLKVKRELKILSKNTEIKANPEEIFVNGFCEWVYISAME